MIVFCLALLVGFAVAIPWALRMDRADFHLMHTRETSCVECDEQ
jgi:hypothetical protein